LPCKAQFKFAAAQGMGAAVSNETASTPMART
jgi:hypothetical protein